MTIRDLWRGLGVLALFGLLGMGIGAFESWEDWQQSEDARVRYAPEAPVSFTHDPIDKVYPNQRMVITDPNPDIQGCYLITYVTSPTQFTARRVSHFIWGCETIP